MARVNEQQTIRSLAVNTVANELDRIDWYGDLIRIRDGLSAEFPAIINTFGDVAATAAAEHFETVTALPATLAPPIADDVIAAEIRTQLTPMFRQNQDINATIKGLLSLVDWSVLGQGDKTMMDSTRNNGVRYAWIPQGKTCGFCILKASRGPVYLSAEKATAPLFRGRHANCDCRAEPVASNRDMNRLRKAGYDPEANYDIYRQARENVKSTDAIKVSSEIDRLTGRK